MVNETSGDRIRSILAGRFGPDIPLMSIEEAKRITDPTDTQKAGLILWIMKNPPKDRDERAEEIQRIAGLCVQLGMTNEETGIEDLALVAMGFNFFV